MLARPLGSREQNRSRACRDVEDTRARCDGGELDDALGEVCERARTDAVVGRAAREKTGGPLARRNPCRSAITGEAWQAPPRALPHPSKAALHRAACIAYSAW